MSNGVLIYGESGTGKSTSIRTLPPEETFILNVVGKPLPFKGSSKVYKKLSSDGLEGNYYSTDNHQMIMKLIKTINEKRPEIKYFVIDDFGFTIANGFMKKALIKGYDKYSELAKNAYEILEVVNELRQDLFCFVIMHCDSDVNGKSKPKTSGKMIDQHVYIEARFTYVFHTIVSERNYKFITNNDGIHMAKSPMGLFDAQLIDNDLMFIVDKINSYLNEDISL